MLADLIGDRFVGYWHLDGAQGRLGSRPFFSSSAVSQLHTLKRCAAPAREWRSGADVLATEMAQGSGSTQALAGLAAIVLGILALIFDQIHFR